MSKKPYALIILDGYGVNERHEGNAIYSAKTPNMDKYMAECPNTIVHASGMDVGLPEGQMGNSEVGHTNIGAGRIVYQPLELINKSIEDKEIYQNKELLKVINHAKENNSKLHLMGLLSNGGVHSHNTHLYALLELCKKEEFDRVYVHCFLDGRDTPPASGESYITELEEKIQEGSTKEVKYE